MILVDDNERLVRLDMDLVRLVDDNVSMAVVVVEDDYKTRFRLICVDDELFDDVDGYDDELLDDVDDVDDDDDDVGNDCGDESWDLCCLPVMSRTTTKMVSRLPDMCWRPRCYSDCLC